MTDADLLELVNGLAEVTKGALERQRVAHAQQIETLMGKMAALEASIAAIPAGPVGPQGQKGPAGADGQPGKDVDPAEVVRLVVGEVAKAMQALPAPKDGSPGASVSSAVIKDGNLLILLSDGTEVTAGSVIGPVGPVGPVGGDGPIGPAGRPGDTGAKGADGVDGKDAAPARDGRDGIPGRDGITVEQVEAAAERIALKMLAGLRPDGRKWHLGDHVVHMPFWEHKGTWKRDVEYEAGDVTVWGGSSWLNTAEKSFGEPGNGESSWRMLSQRGRDGSKRPPNGPRP